MAQPLESGPYAVAFAQYQRVGWAVIPVHGKYPPEPGWTGAQGEWPSYADMLTWADGAQGKLNIAIRLPRNVIGIDVDAYTDKRGAATLAECESRWGALPATWWSTSRDDGKSGIRLFQIPEGLSWPGQLPGGGVEVIIWNHRYVVSWPSLHPEGRVYRWISREGTVSLHQVPAPNELPFLPDAWVNGLSRGEYHQEPKAALDLGGGAAWLVSLSGADQPPCPRLAGIVRHLVGELAQPASRHEAALLGTLNLIRRGEEGHPGILESLRVVGESFVLAVTGDGSRTTRSAWAEWTRITEGAVAKMVGTPRTPSLGDPCIVPSDPPWTPGDPLPGRTHTSGATGTPGQDAGHTEPPSPLVAPPGVSPKLFGERVTWLRADRAARTYLLAESVPTADEQPPDIGLDEFVGVEDEPAIYRVNGLLPVGGRVVLAAQMKTGKTTFIGNLIKSLVDGEPFLGSFPVEPPEGNVVLLDNEMDERTLRRWLRDMTIRNGGKARVIPMMGRVSGFDIRIPEVFNYWAQRLRAMKTTVLIVDCLKPILDVLALDERNETGKITTPLTNLKFAADISEIILVHHMGHNGERSRGDSALRGWPEVEWQLVRLAEDPDREAPMDAARFFKAYGRDVNVPESKLTYRPNDRSLSIGEGTRDEARVKDANDQIIELVGRNPGINTGGIEAGIGGRKGGLRLRLLALVDQDVLRVEEVGKTKKYYPGPLFPPFPRIPPGGGGSPQPSPITPPKGGYSWGGLFGDDLETPEDE